jgi:hypothetical protein
MEALQRDVAWIRSRWGLGRNVDSTPIPGLPEKVEGVIHELCHVVTFPIPAPCDSTELSLLFEHLPDRLQKNLEIAAWMVERRFFATVGFRMSYGQIGREARETLTSSDPGCSRRWPLERVEKTMRKWQGPWVSEQARHVTWMLTQKRWKTGYSPEAVWKF